MSGGMENISVERCRDCGSHQQAEHGAGLPWDGNRADVVGHESDDGLTEIYVDEDVCSIGIGDETELKCEMNKPGGIPTHQTLTKCSLLVSLYPHPKGRPGGLGCVLAALSGSLPTATPDPGQISCASRCRSAVEKEERTEQQTLLSGTPSVASRRTRPQDRRAWGTVMRQRGPCTPWSASWPRATSPGAAVSWIASTSLAELEKKDGFDVSLRKPCWPQCPKM